MIIVVARLQAKAEKRAEFIALAEYAVEATRREPGCLSYTLYQDPACENDFVFIEEWEELDALRRHFGTPHLNALTEALPELLSAEADVRLHVVERTMDMADIANG